MHDAAEAFLGDVTRPLKQLLPEYKKIEANVEAAIFARFGIERSASSEMEAADVRVLAAEQQQIMPPARMHGPRGQACAPHPWKCASFHLQPPASAS